MYELSHFLLQLIMCFELMETRRRMQCRFILSWKGTAWTF